ncbi:hypothetical protein BCR37DRAFT_393088 [Protomyces lactucae-debilis]|uniref:Glycosyltransferase family 92 protein n=1 Tax=Protomyces lactucae-debilis TaxID=2754530 RepID=A0A1Y2FEL7_PROLT|nr:uncharacterized protein BCR37DRAFT_393088 [Protomyces lactucae-debilis]ORY82047.1 hypothetical protein BCR37DRAFT_393088 [Protomyces lactucae-debilis]
MPFSCTLPRAYLIPVQLGLLTSTLLVIYFTYGRDYSLTAWDSVKLSTSSNHMPATNVESFSTSKPHLDAPKTGVPGDEEEYVALCFTAKNEGRNLPEVFQHFYHHIGIRRFYIMDDGSRPPLSTFDYPIPSSAITFYYVTPEERHQVDNQLYMNRHCHKMFGHQHTWIGFFDSDEYLEVVSPEETLVSILKGLDANETIGALGVNWKMHSSAGHLTRPESTRKSFTKCFHDDPDNNGEHSDNKHVKSFVKTKYFNGNINPHVYNLLNDTITVGEDEEPWDWQVLSNPNPAFRIPITRNRLSLHHYAIKSKEEYEEKMERSKNIEAGKTDWGFWDHVEAGPLTDCFEMTHYEP